MEGLSEELRRMLEEQAKEIQELQKRLNLLETRLEAVDATTVKNGSWEPVMSIGRRRN